MGDFRACLKALWSAGDYREVCCLHLVTSVTYFISFIYHIHTRWSCMYI